jgi:hypothetical protein
MSYYFYRLRDEQGSWTIDVQIGGSIGGWHGIVGQVILLWCEVLCHTHVQCAAIREGEIVLRENRRGEREIEIHIKQ